MNFSPNHCSSHTPNHCGYDCCSSRCHSSISRQRRDVRSNGFGSSLVTLSGTAGLFEHNLQTQQLSINIPFLASYFCATIHNTVPHITITITMNVIEYKLPTKAYHYKIIPRVSHLFLNCLNVAVVLCIAKAIWHIWNYIVAIVWPLNQNSVPQ